jgi:hypothetical protein
MHQQLSGYKAEEKIHLGVCEQKRLNITGLDKHTTADCWQCCRQEIFGPCEDKTLKNQEKER